MPMHTRHTNDVLQPLQLPHNQRPVCPGARIGNIEMIPVLLSGELGTGLVGDEGAEDALLALELARLVAGFHPVEDVGVFLVLEEEW